MLMIGLMAAIFWLFILRPQQRRQKQQVSFQEAVKKGDKVVTSSGILGRVTKVDSEEQTITLEVGKGTYLDFTAGSVSRDLTEAKYGAAESK